MTSQLIYTSSPEFSGDGLAELQTADPKLKKVRELAEGVVLVSSPLPYDALAGILTLDPPVFVRHICPAPSSVPLKNSQFDIEALAEAIVNLPEFDTLTADTPFSIQARFVDENKERRYTTFAIKEFVAGVVTQSSGAVENIKSPEIVISVVGAGDTGYVGISRADENLSTWAGGARRFAHLPEQISRAELKLIEAIEVFDIALPKEGVAVDLGAAPGGWTRVLLEAGMRVIAVDPATLDPRLDKYGDQLDYRQDYAAPFLQAARANGQTFDLIANDMRMDAQLAAEIVRDLYDLLTPNGLVITTLKLPHTAPNVKPGQILKRALATLQTRYNSVQARQLFHNRQEVTVLLQP